VALSASTQKMAERTLRAVGRPELIEDPRYRTNAERVKNAADLDAIIGAFVGERSQADNVAFFEKAEVTIGPIYDVSQIVEDPHFVEREILADYPDEDMGAFPMHHVVPRLMSTPGAIRSPAPKLGEHNRQLLSELGFSAEKYRKMLEDGSVCEGERASRGEDG
jgi:formyl-CoA transferase